MVKTQRLLATLVLAAVCAVAAVAPAQARVVVTPGPWCGGTLWKLMTLSDKGRATVKWTPAATSVSDIAKLATPAIAPSTRSTPFEKQVWQLSVVVDRYRVASNGEIVLVLYDIPSSTYMDAYLPNPRCLSSTSRGRADMIAARTAFLKCPAPTVGWQQNGVSVVLSGVGFWNPARSTKGALPNGAEIRPVTSLKIVSGCGI
jgi:hypothetical protein